MNARDSVKDIFEHAVEAVNPYRSVRRHLENNTELWEGGTSIVGFGKAVCGMARACEDVIGHKIVGGLLVTKYAHAEKMKMLEVKEAAHPVPDENSIRHTQEIVDYVWELSSGDGLICLISGGGSALFCKPYEGLSLRDKQKTTDLLLKAGADIFELNTVRKHLSDVKGGRFLRYFRGSHMTSLILSDVLGDRLDVIASGTTIYDESTYPDALDVIRKYDLEDSVPDNVMKLLHDGVRGLVPETVKSGDAALKRVENIIVGSLSTAIKAAQKRAVSLGMDVILMEDFVTGEAVEAGKVMGVRIQEIAKRRSTRPLCVISGGETTVTVRGEGKGGRNMELALSFAETVSGLEGVTMLSAGTDGGDGPTDAAGAIVDWMTVSRAVDRGISASAYLANNDTYNFFKRTGDLFMTGPTGTNVMDIQIAVIQ